MRSQRAKKRPIETDIVYKSKLVTRMVNVVMDSGRKATAQGIVYGAIDKLSEDRKEAVQIFEQAIKNIMPTQEVRSRRVGGATYQVPVPVKHDRAEALAVRWLVNAAKAKKGRPMGEKLYEELKNAHEGTGNAIRKREDTHKMAEANRAFAHFGRF